MFTPFQSALGLATADLIPPSAGPFPFSGPVPPIVNFQTSRPLASNHHLSVPVAKLDLSNMTAGGVNLLGNRSRARRAAPGSAL